MLDQVDNLNQLRLSNDTRLLKETDHSNSEIANYTGFSDQSYFDKRFRRAFGQSPKEFRAVACTLPQANGSSLPMEKP
jgi:AraC-like DNA-binding protein